MYVVHGDRGEFEIARHDGAYKVDMSLMGQQKHGCEIRRIDGVGRRAAIDQKSGKTSAHVAHTLTTAGGATVAATAEYGECRTITIDFIRKSLWGELEGEKYLIQVGIIYTDRARDFDHGAYWSLIPNLTAIASDPRQRCIEVESCSGGKVKRRSAPLRKLHRKFAPSDTTNLKRDSLARSGYFSQRAGGRQGSHVRTCEECRLLENDYWAEERCGRIITQLETEAHVKKPFRKRSEYADLVLALIHSSEHADQMSRRNKSATAETILRRAIAPPNVGYLLNGSRYIAQREAIGTTTNEALAG